MIASFQHNFVFIKTRKVASTSVEIALGPICGPEDVVTPIAIDDEIIRMQLAGGDVIARNYAVSADVERLFCAVVRKFNSLHPELHGHDAYRHAVHQIPRWRENRFYSHMPAADAARKLGAKFWDSAFKFTIERHPYEWVVSAASHRLANRGLPQSELPRIINQAIKSGLRNESLYMIDNRVAVDEIIRHETLEHDLRRISEKLGFTIKLPLPRAKGQYRVDRRPAHEILSQTQKEMIYETCRSVFDRLGYEP